LERELDAAISAAARARAEKRQAEAAQKAAELRAQEITRELENTTSMYANSSFQYPWMSSQILRAEPALCLGLNDI